MFNPAIKQIADDLGSDEQHVIATTTSYVVMLGIGPLILAPMSETFGRRNLYLICFGIFALLQIPTALSPTADFMIAIRTITGFFGSMSLHLTLLVFRSMLLRSSLSSSSSSRLAEQCLNAY